MEETHSIVNPDVQEESKKKKRTDKRPLHSRKIKSKQMSSHSPFQLPLPDMLHS
jgi:hypothetical protein